MKACPSSVLIPSSITLQMTTLVIIKWKLYIRQVTTYRIGWQRNKRQVNGCINGGRCIYTFHLCYYLTGKNNIVPVAMSLSKYKTGGALLSLCRNHKPCQKYSYLVHVSMNRYIHNKFAMSSICQQQGYHIGLKYLWKRIGCPFYTGINNSFYWHWNVG